MEIVMEGVEEYGEGYAVLLLQEEGRWIINAANEGMQNCTRVDLVQLIDWIRHNKPELLKEDNDNENNVAV
jgi:hypothetical protein